MAENEKVKTSAKAKKKVKKKSVAIKNAQKESNEYPSPTEKARVDSSKDEALSADKLLTVFLILSILLNVYLVYQYIVVSENLSRLIESGVNPNPQVIGVSGGQAIPKGSSNTALGEKARVEFYVMSICPYGVQVMDGIAPVLKEMGDSIDFNVDYIADVEGDGFRSLKGQPEVEENIRQLCAIEYYSKDYKYMDYVVCRNQNIRSADWRGCATANGMDADKIEACATSDTGKKLFTESLNRAKNAKATGSPTIYMDGERYGGGRDPKSFKKVICQMIDNANPACSDIAEDIAFKVKVLTDKRCGADCDTSQLILRLKEEFPKMQTEILDYSSAEGKKLYQETKTKYLPAFLFEMKVKDASNYQNLERYFQSAGSYLALAIGGEFDPTAEICDNGVDDTGNGLVDCEDPTCSSLPVCMNFEKPTLTFFIMSYCPYGNQAEEGIEPVFQLLGDKAIFEPRYIYYPDYRGGGPSMCMDSENQYCSMHGVQEANQNIREQCVEEMYGLGAWFEFTIAMNRKCSAQNADTCWTAVAKDLGYDVARVKSCQENDYAKYAAVDLEMSQGWGASGSPTIFLNGKLYSGARTPEGYKQALCALFVDKPAECDTKLEGETVQTAPQGAC